MRGNAYAEHRELVLAIARILNAEARALADRGASLLQIDEPFLAGYPDQVSTAVEAVNVVTKDVDVTWALHVCYGNRYARPLWEGHYDFLFPAVLTRRSTSSSWSSPARVTRICPCWKSPAGTATSGSA